MSLLRTARVLFPRLSSTTATSASTNTRAFTCLSQSARRPNLISLGGYGKVEAKLGGYGGAQEQVRGMKVRSSVKKLCEGCKVRCHKNITCWMRTGLVEARALLKHNTKVLSWAFISEADRGKKGDWRKTVAVPKG
jgi:large subunit ribosomal protein L36